MAGADITKTVDLGARKAQPALVDTDGGKTADVQYRIVTAVDGELLDRNLTGECRAESREI